MLLPERPFKSLICQMEIVKTTSTSCDPISVIDLSSFNKDEERPGSVQLDLFWLGGDSFVLYPHTTNKKAALFPVIRKMQGGEILGS